MWSFPNISLVSTGLCPSWEAVASLLRSKHNRPCLRDWQHPAKFSRPTFFTWESTGLGFNTIPLRGYDDRGVGPPSGGLSMIKHSAELRYALSINPIPIYTLLFAEAGNVWSEPRITDPLDLRRSAGVGVRLMINPIGLVGFDYGYGFDAATPGDGPPGWRFHFQFGKGF